MIGLAREVGEACPFKQAQAVWSPDDSRIVVLLHDSPTGVRLFTMATDGSDRRVLVRWDETANNRWEAGRNSTAMDGKFEWAEAEQ